MRILRVIFALAGLGILAWGVLRLLPVFKSPDVVSALIWLGGGPVLHDALLAPIVAMVGTLLARVLPRSWRQAVTVGAVLSGVLVLIAVPALWRSSPGEKGLVDRNYPLGLTIALAVVWVTVLASAAIRSATTRATPSVSTSKSED
jgi:hypothetical protein